MKQFVFRQKSIKDGQSVQRRTYTGRFRLPGDTRDTQVALGVTDKRVAEKKLSQIVQDEQERRAGIGVARFNGLETLLHDALYLWCDDLRTRNRGDKYIKDVERFIIIVSDHARWKQLSDITPEGFIFWRSANNSKAPKTLNEYLNSLNAFLNWLVQRETIISNPLLRVPKCETRGYQKRVRRAFTKNELRRLIAKSPGDRSLVYHAAAYTGIRRGELETITWQDVQLDNEVPHIVIQAKYAKNKRTETIPLHPELVQKLVAKKLNSPTLPVFDVPKRMTLFKRDLEIANIPYLDEDGRQADFHALRHTFATMLHAGGANQAVTMQAMRHSDPRLTAVTYNDANLLPVSHAIFDLPNLGDGSLGSPIGSPIGSPNLDAEGHNLSQADARDLRKKFGNDSESEEESHCLSHYDAKCQNPAVAPAVGFEPTT